VLSDNGRRANIVAYRPALWVLALAMDAAAAASDDETVPSAVFTVLTAGAAALSDLGYDVAVVAPGALCGDGAAPFDA
jgi:hypothetical protein